MDKVTRKEKVKEMLESFSSLRRATTFGAAGHAKMPPITPAQWSALMTIEQRGESALKDVAEALGITSSATTQLVDGLVRSGYVVRAVDQGDRRTVTLTLSNKARAHVTAMKKQVLQRFLTFFEVLSDKELNQYLGLHKKIIERLSKNKKI